MRRIAEMNNGKLTLPKLPVYYGKKRKPPKWFRDFLRRMRKRNETLAAELQDANPLHPDNRRRCETPTTNPRSTPRMKQTHPHKRPAHVATTQPGSPRS